jgi:hypothetical protein
MWKRSLRRLMCSLFNSCLPLKTSDTMLGIPNTSTKSFCKTVLVHKEVQYIQRICLRKLIPSLLEILNQQRQEFCEFLLNGCERFAAPVEIVKNFRVSFSFSVRITFGENLVRSALYSGVLRKKGSRSRLERSRLVSQQGLEGMVAKDKQSPYVSGSKLLAVKVHLGWNQYRSCIFGLEVSQSSDLPTSRERPFFRRLPPRYDIL